MKLDDVIIDPDKREQGAWVKDIPNLDDLELKVRGRNNRDWARMEQKLTAAVPRHRRLNGMEWEEQQKITNTLLLNTSLLDWRGLKNGNGEEIPYSKELARKYLTDPRYERFAEGCFWAAVFVAEIGQAEVEADAKN